MLTYAGVCWRMRQFATRVGKVFCAAQIRTTPGCETSGQKYIYTTDIIYTTMYYYIPDCNAVAIHVKKKNNMYQSATRWLFISAMSARLLGRRRSSIWEKTTFRARRMGGTWTKAYVSSTTSRALREQLQALNPLNSTWRALREQLKAVNRALREQLKALNRTLREHHQQILAAARL